jgi:hypothetical protein
MRTSMRYGQAPVSSPAPRWKRGPVQFAGTALRVLRTNWRWKRGPVQFAGTALRVLRTNWTSPLFQRPGNVANDFARVVRRLAVHHEDLVTGRIVVLAQQLGERAANVAAFVPDGHDDGEEHGGQWSVVSGQWSVVSGQLSVVSCQWSVVSGQWSVVARMTNGQLGRFPALRLFDSSTSVGSG